MIGRPVQLTPKLHPAMETLIPIIGINIDDHLHEWIVHPALYVDSSGITDMFDHIGDWDLDNGAGVAPALVEDDAAYNGHNSMTMVNGEQNFLQSAAQSGIAQPFSVYYVGQDGDVDGANDFILCNENGGIGPASPRVIWQNSNNQIAINAGTALAGATNSRDASPHIGLFIFDGTNSQIWKNNTQSGSTGDAGADTWDGISVFQDADVSNRVADGSKLTHFGIIGADVDADGTRESLFDQLGALYGITVA